MFRSFSRSPQALLRLLLPFLIIGLPLIVPDNSPLAQSSQSAGAWIRANPMNVARKAHTATLLRDGRVLVAGGEDSSFQMLNSAEIYDPATGQWSLTGNLNEPRSGHSAVLLADGKVLIVGRQSAEIFDPATSKWTPTADMLSKGGQSHYTGASVTQLANGKVVVAGGFSGSLSFARSWVELFDPIAGTWKAASPMKATRYNHSATLLPDGKLLVAGGSARAADILASAEIYDPATDNWTSVSSLNQTRSGHQAVLLLNGKVMVFGGAAAEEIYDPATNRWRLGGKSNQPHIQFATVTLPDAKIMAIGGGTNRVELYTQNETRWTFTADLSIPRRNHTATVLRDGRVLVTGGGGNGEAFQTAEIFAPNQRNESGIWLTTPQTISASAGHIATQLSDGRVLFAGGSAQQSASAASQIYLPDTGNLQDTGALNFARRNHTATLLPNGQVLTVGGEQNNNATLLSCELFDPATRSWQTTASLVTPRRFHTATGLADGKVLVTGGANENTDLESTEIYDPATGRWNSAGSLNTARRWHTAILLTNGRVLVIGGSRNGVPLDSAELYDPTTGRWTATGSLKTARHLHTATRLNNGKVLVAGGFKDVFLASAEIYDPITGQWTDAGKLNQSRQNHTATLMPDGRVLVAGGSERDGATSSAEIFDPSVNNGLGIWHTTDSLDTTRELHSALLLPNGKVLAAGGRNIGGTVGSAEIFDSALLSTPLLPRIVPVSAGSYLGESFAPESIIAVFGEQFTTGVTVANSTPLPQKLGGVSVTLTDRLGLSRTAPLFFVSPNQVNCQIPSQTVTGLLTMTLTTNAGAAISELVMINPVSPSLFTLDASGKGLPTAVLLRVKTNGAQVYEPIAQFDQMQNRFVALPIDLSDPNEQVFLILYGTGLRFRSSLSATTGNVGSLPVEVLYVGVQGDFVGLDQVNLRLPRSLTGRGEVDVQVSADGFTSNAVKVSIK